MRIRKSLPALLLTVFMLASCDGNTINRTTTPNSTTEGDTSSSAEPQGFEVLTPEIVP